MSRLFAGTQFDIPPTCDLCGEMESRCECTPAEKDAAETLRRIESGRIAPQKQTAIVRTEKRKGGRTVTVIAGLTATANDLLALLSQMQAACGTGGTVKRQDDLIELQGDHTATARECLAEIGYRLKQ